MYYPLNKIKSNLYTSGNEFIIAETKRSYTGPYYATFDSKYFTGAQPAATATELIKNVGSTTTPTVIEQTYAVVTGENYKAGVIQRYFMRRVNGEKNSITEITGASYDHIQQNPLYLTITLLWSVTNNKGDADRSNLCYKINKSRVMEADKQMPGIKFYLTNYLELSR